MFGMENTWSDYKTNCIHLKLSVTLVSNIFGEIYKIVIFLGPCSMIPIVYWLYLAEPCWHWHRSWHSPCWRLPPSSKTPSHPHQHKTHHSSRLATRGLWQSIVVIHWNTRYVATRGHSFADKKEPVDSLLIFKNYYVIKSHQTMLIMRGFPNKL